MRSEWRGTWCLLELLSTGAGRTGLGLSSDVCDSVIKAVQSVTVHMQTALLSVTGRGTLLLVVVLHVMFVPTSFSVSCAPVPTARSKEEHCRGLSHKEYGTSGPRAPLTKRLSTL